MARGCPRGRRMALGAAGLVIALHTLACCMYLLPPRTVARGFQASSWGHEKLQAGSPLRVVVSGLSRWSAVVQFDMIRSLLTESVSLFNASLSTADERDGEPQLQACLASRYCVALVHSFLPDVLLRVHAVFLSHRDVRAVLRSSANHHGSCLLSGPRSLMTAFSDYARWLPHACDDVAAEDLRSHNTVQHLRRYAQRLGLDTLLSLPKLQQLASALATTTWRQRQGVASRVANEVPVRAHSPWHTAAATCRVDAELRLVESGWGRWLETHGYARSSAEAARLRQANDVVDALPQRRELMEGRAWLAGDATRCPLQTAWTRALERSGVWAYSLLRLNTSRGAPHHDLLEHLRAVRDNLQTTPTRASHGPVLNRPTQQERQAQRRAEALLAGAVRRGPMRRHRPELT